jgi:2'-5' RNA ligase/ribosomal protein S18 acetylase RimI-like enzyme
MPKRRLGVALLVPPPFDREVDTLRKACDDGTIGRRPAHCTLVPPVNVREDNLTAAIAVLRSAAAATRPFTAVLGPPGTFFPDNPTLFLRVSGDGLPALQSLRDSVFREPLARPLTWPFVPHVTLADEMAPERIEAAVEALAGYRAAVTFERVHLLEEGKDRVWHPIADATFATPAVVGRGGIELELSVTDRPDAEADEFQEAAWAAERAERLGPDATPERPFAITGRAGGRVVGVASGWTHGGVAHLQNLVVDAARRGEGIGSRLLAAFESLAAERDCHRLVVRTYVETPAYAFYLQRGWQDETRFKHWIYDRELVQLRRDL